MLFRLNAFTALRSLPGVDRDKDVEILARREVVLPCGFSTARIPSCAGIAISLNGFMPVRAG
ncbi:hypothetical protein ACTWPT_34825 [Nonomuraea sp. 3N208]|uniref:hypothetical protein n=1 Tax=Nonomuraea sp. 3N208 TaxID=3457421 RepID=UPI003FCEFB7C